MLPPPGSPPELPSENRLPLLLLRSCLSDSAPLATGIQLLLAAWSLPGQYTEPRGPESREAALCIFSSPSVPGTLLSLLHTPDSVSEGPSSALAP